MDRASGHVLTCAFRNYPLVLRRRPVGESQHEESSPVRDDRHRGTDKHRKCLKCGNKITAPRIFLSMNSTGAATPLCERAQVGTPSRGKVFFGTSRSPSQHRAMIQKR